MTRTLSATLSLLLVGSAIPCVAEQFEVATVKLMDPNAPMTVGFEIHPGARVVASGLSLKTLIGAAFQQAYWQMSGGEAWMEKDVYRIEAKPAEDSGITNLRHTLFAIEDPRLREMLQALLAERFQLKVHRESKTGDVYSLTRTSKPLLLRPVDAGADPSRTAFGSVGYANAKWTIANTDMAQLAKYASERVVRAPVADRTGLTGFFNYRQATPDDDPNYTDNTDSFLRQMTEIGLKLEKSKGPVEILVIDGASKPSEN